MIYRLLPAQHQSHFADCHCERPLRHCTCCTHPQGAVQVSNLKHKEGIASGYRPRNDYLKRRDSPDSDPKMNNSYASQTSDERDEYPKVTQADLDRAAFRVGLKPAPRKRRVTILLDTGLVEYFKAKAGERGYQTSINDTLRQTVERDDLEERLRRIIREEMQREGAPGGV